MTKPENSGHPPATLATTATNEWGLPDWQDATSYGDCKKWNLLQWRWEFTRRRDDYREDFEAHTQTKSESCRFVPYTGEWETDFFEKHEIGFAAEPCPNLLQKYKMWQMPNPRFSAQPMDVIFCTGYPGGHTRLCEGTRKTADGGPCQLTIEEHEAAVIFDLNEPLADQLATAKRFLQRAQRKVHGHKIQKRRHADKWHGKWLGYLRALDAREAGATYAEMTETFHAQGLLDRRKNPSGGYCDPPPQAARDMWKAAHYLMTQGWN